jgi:predicted acyl esterase
MMNLNHTEKVQSLSMGRFRMLSWVVLLVAAIVFAGSCKDQTQQIEKAASETGASFYIKVKDGTRLAADVYLPGAEAGKRYPALLTLTRYQRGHENPKTGEPLPGNSPLDRHFLKHGYERGIFWQSASRVRTRGGA